MVIGLTKPDDGRVYLDGQEITKDPVYARARKGITYLSQEPSVFRKLTVEENLLAILESLNIPEQEMKRRLKSLLTELNISHLAKQKAYSLSGGERRRLEITRALVTSRGSCFLMNPLQASILWLLMISTRSSSN